MRMARKRFDANDKPATQQICESDVSRCDLRFWDFKDLTMTAIISFTQAEPSLTVKLLLNKKAPGPVGIPAIIVKLTN